MSEVARAREIIEVLLRSNDVPFIHRSLRMLLPLLQREKPQFVAPPVIRALSEAEKERARCMRDEGWPLNKIAVALRTNIGRVSEAVNPERYNGKGF